jgi:hypothetical protein
MENRLLVGGTGDNTDGSINFIPKMGYEALARGYKLVVDTIYAPKQYYERIKTFLREYRPGYKGKLRLSLLHLIALIRSMWVLGVKEKGRIHYWKLFVWTLLKKPESFPLSMMLAIQGLHYRKVADKIRVSLTSDVCKLEPVGEPAGKHS